MRSSRHLDTIEERRVVDIMSGSLKKGHQRAEARPTLDHPLIMHSLIITIILAGLVVLVGQPHPVADKEPITHLPKVTQTASALAPVDKPSQTIIAPEPVKPPEPVAPKVPTTKEEIMEAAGIAQSDWAAVDFIISRESGWCAMKWENELGACPTENSHKYAEDNAGRGYGLCQSTPANKMASAGDDWRTNPVTQLKWCNSHAVGSHGSWWKAQGHWVAKRWW